MRPTIATEFGDLMLLPPAALVDPSVRAAIVRDIALAAEGGLDFRPTAGACAAPPPHACPAGDIILSPGSRCKTAQCRMQQTDAAAAAAA